MAKQLKNETNHDLNCNLVRQSQTSLLSYAEEETYEDVLAMPEFRTFKNKTMATVNTVDAFSAWILDKATKPRKPEKPQDSFVKVNKEKIRREAWRTEGKLREIHYVFQHRADPQQYMEDYRKSYTFRNFTMQRNCGLDNTNFVALSRVPWTDNTRRQQERLPPKLVQRLTQDNMSSRLQTENSLPKEAQSTKTCDRKETVKPRGNCPVSSNPNSANTKQRPRSSPNHKPSLLELQHKYKLDPNVIKLTVAKAPTPEPLTGHKSGRSSAAGSQLGSAKTSKQTVQSLKNRNTRSPKLKRASDAMTKNTNGLSKGIHTM